MQETGIEYVQKWWKHLILDTHLKEVSNSDNGSIDHRKEQQSDSSSEGNVVPVYPSFASDNELSSYLFNIMDSFSVLLKVPNGTLSTSDSESSSRGDNIVSAADRQMALMLQIPIPVEQIVELPMPLLRQGLSLFKLDNNQKNIIRKIRRRGRNKAAVKKYKKSRRMASSGSDQQSLSGKSNVHG